MIFKLKIVGLDNIKMAQAAGAKFNPRGNNFEIECDVLPPELARFVSCCQSRNPAPEHRRPANSGRVECQSGQLRRSRP